MIIEELNRKMPKITLVFGRLCSGKGTFCQQYTKNGYAHFTTSDFVKKVSGKQTRSGLSTTADLDQRIADEMIDTIDGLDLVIIDGIRQVSIVQRILNHFGEDEVDLVWLEVPADIRRERFDKRAATKDDISFEDAEAGDSKLGLDDVEATFKPKSRVVNYL